MDGPAAARRDILHSMPENGIYRSRALPEIEIGLAAFWKRVEDDLA